MSEFLSMMKVRAPFSDEYVKLLNEYQSLYFVHPFTCGGQHCDRSQRDDNGILIAKNEGWFCPCGDYYQNWAHGFMLHPEALQAAHDDMMKRFSESFSDDDSKQKPAE
jgi:hypothetical protein